jgi:hypothetical protein
VNEQGEQGGPAREGGAEAAPQTRRPKPLRKAVVALVVACAAVATFVVASPAFAASPSPAPSPSSGSTTHNCPNM